MCVCQGAAPQINDSDDESDGFHAAGRQTDTVTGGQTGRQKEKKQIGERKKVDRQSDKQTRRHNDGRTDL